MKVYLYDGSFEGLLTTIYYTYREKEPFTIAATAMHHPMLLEEKIPITTDSAIADRVYNSILEKLSAATLKNVYYLYLSEIDAIEKLIIDYIKLCFQYSATINLAKNNTIIATVDKQVRRVSLEAHRFHGFIRFEEVQPMVFYASLAPDYHILPLIMEHFKTRFSDQHFILHDLNREVAAVYNLVELYLMPLPSSFYHNLREHTTEDPFKTLFKSYYSATTIKERTNPRQQRSYMPKRYWKHLFEVSSNK